MPESIKVWIVCSLFTDAQVQVVGNFLSRFLFECKNEGHDTSYKTPRNGANQVFEIEFSLEHDWAQQKTTKKKNEREHNKSNMGSSHRDDRLVHLVTNSIAKTFTFIVKISADTVRR